MRLVALCLSLACLAGHCHGFSSPYGETSRNVATQILQGAGPSKVDMNLYNLNDLETGRSIKGSRRLHTYDYNASPFDLFNGRFESARTSCCKLLTESMLRINCNLAWELVRRAKSLSPVNLLLSFMRSWCLRSIPSSPRSLRPPPVA
jgi:hypothetical protein